MPADEFERVPGVGQCLRIFAKVRTGGGHLHALVPAMGRCGKSNVSDQISAFMAALRAREAVAARGLDFMILTAARTGLSPRRSFGGESIFQAKVWVAPPSRMKSGREPRVPLSRAVISVLKVQAHHQDDGVSGRSARETPVEHGHVFGAWTSQVMAHGFRSTFRDWAAECTNFPREGALSLEIVSVESSICNGEQRPTSA